MRLNNIEAIMFDSGKVLNEPLMGHWFISPKFFTYVNKSAFENISMKRRNVAFSKALAYINSIIVMKTKEEEYEHFDNIYTVFSDELPELQLNKININALAKDLVYNMEKYKFFDDATKVIPILDKKYKLAI